ncbi:MAG TPA: TolC family protein, partial [Balneolaceae bacterium]|nr:TolC family protein [Balneolaceae bacterium]
MIITFLFSFLLVTHPLAQTAPADTLTLPHAYELMYQNYPEAKNIELQKKIESLNVTIANTGYYPQIKVKGRATYQSEVTGFDLPADIGPEPLSKDQYRASVSVVQNIFNGGAVGLQKEMQKTISRQKANTTEVSLYKMRRQLNQVYYGILL